MVRKSVNLGLPARPFLYTIDQIAGLIDVEEHHLRTHYVYFDGRSTGYVQPHHIRARNIAPPKLAPEWRVAENELKRWLKNKGFKLYELTVIRSG